MPRLNETPVSEIPEVAAFVEVQERLKAFKETNKEFFDYLDTLSEEYNAKLHAASTVVRGKSVSCGPFDKFQTATKYDADELYSLLGRKKFLELGGKEELVKKYSLDKVRVEMYIKSGDIDEDVAKVVKKVSPRYRSIDEMKVP